MRRLVALAALLGLLASAAQAQHVSLGGAVPLNGSTCTDCTLSGTTTLSGMAILPGGGSIGSTGIIISGVQANRLGSTGGSSTSPTRDNTNLLLYNISATNYAGIGADSSGGVYIVNGTTSPITRLYINNAGLVGIGGNTIPQNILSIGTTSATAQTLNSLTDASNFESAFLGSWASNVARYGTNKGGTGTARDSTFHHGGSEIARLTASAFSSLAGLIAYSGTAIPAGGTAGTGFKFSSTANFGIFFGSGAPTLSAAKGSLYLRSDGSGTGDRAYINTDGGTTWTALTTAS